MFSMVINEWLSTSNNNIIEEERFIDFGPFEFFECEGETSEHDEIMMEKIYQLILSNSKFENVPEEYLKKLLTIHNYRKFYSMIQRFVFYSFFISYYLLKFL